jgi:hypothetical protein
MHKVPIKPPNQFIPSFIMSLYNELTPPAPVTWKAHPIRARTTLPAMPIPPLTALLADTAMPGTIVLNPIALTETIPVSSHPRLTPLLTNPIPQQLPHKLLPLRLIPRLLYLPFLRPRRHLLIIPFLKHTPLRSTLIITVLHAHELNPQILNHIIRISLNHHVEQALRISSEARAHTVFGVVFSEEIFKEFDVDVARLLHLQEGPQARPNFMQAHLGNLEPFLHLQQRSTGGVISQDPYRVLVR